MVISLVSSIGLTVISMGWLLLMVFAWLLQVWVSCCDCELALVTVGWL